MRTSARWWVGALLGAVTLASVAVSARADDFPDEVTLKNGGSVRGTIVSVEPNTDVKIIEGGSNAVRVVPWADVADVAKGKYATPAAPPAVAPPAQVIVTTPGFPPPTQFGWLPVAPPPQLKTRLHVTSPEPADVLLPPTYAGTVNGLAVGAPGICSAPCDREITYSPGSEFSVRGDFPGSAPFTLDGMGTDAELVVDPGSRGQRISGRVLLGLGITGTLAGAIMMPIGAGLSTKSEPTYDNGSFSDTKSSPNHKLIDAGAISLGAGVVSIITGVVLMATSHTHYVVQPRGLAPLQSSIKPSLWAGSSSVASLAPDAEHYDPTGLADHGSGASVLGLKATF